MELLDFYHLPGQLQYELNEASWFINEDPLYKKHLVKHFTKTYFNGVLVNGCMPAGQVLDSSCPSDLVYVGTGTRTDLTQERITIHNNNLV